jgi:ribose 1,5-bisphosphate isomerase
MEKQTRFNKICREIKKVHIQGAREVAKKAFFAYKLIPTEKSKHALISLRPTEPMLVNILKRADELSYKELINRLNENQKKINEQIFRLIKNNSVIFTHCHSSSVVQALIYAKKHGKRFEVYNTETRPLYQGRKTANELRKNNIKVTMFVDSAAAIAIEKENRKDKIHADLILFGTDAILGGGVINKIGSGMFAEIAHASKVPVYIVADSWKYARKIKIEQRDSKEIWDTKKVLIKNPAFELIKRKYVTGIVSELGILSYNKFLKKVHEK